MQKTDPNPNRHSRVLAGGLACAAIVGLLAIAEPAEAISPPALPTFPGVTADPTTPPALGSAGPGQPAAATAVPVQAPAPAPNPTPPAPAQTPIPSAGPTTTPPKKPAGFVTASVSAGRWLVLNVSCARAGSLTISRIHHESVTLGRRSFSCPNGQAVTRLPLGAAVKKTLDRTRHVTLVARVGFGGVTVRQTLSLSLVKAARKLSALDTSRVWSDTDVACVGSASGAGGQMVFAPASYATLGAHYLDTVYWQTWVYYSNSSGAGWASGPWASYTPYPNGATGDGPGVVTRTGSDTYVFVGGTTAPGVWETPVVWNIARATWAYPVITSWSQSGGGYNSYPVAVSIAETGAIWSAGWCYFA